MAKNPYARWYWKERWRRISRAQLAAHPLCAFCLAGDVITPATVCDHVEDHKGDETKFWSGPFQSLCAPCHSGTKQRAEHGRQVHLLDDDGWPQQSG